MSEDRAIDNRQEGLLGKLRQNGRLAKLLVTLCCLLCEVCATALRTAGWRGDRSICASMSDNKITNTAVL